MDIIDKSTCKVSRFYGPRCSALLLVQGEKFNHVSSVQLRRSVYVSTTSFGGPRQYHNTAVQLMYLLSSPRGRKKIVSSTVDGYKVGRGVISSYKSAITSDIVKRV